MLRKAEMRAWRRELMPAGNAPRDEDERLCRAGRWQGLADCPGRRSPSKSDWMARCACAWQAVEKRFAGPICARKSRQTPRIVRASQGFSTGVQAIAAWPIVSPRIAIASPRRKIKRPTRPAEPSPCEKPPMNASPKPRPFAPGSSLRENIPIPQQTGRFRFASTPPFLAG